MRAKFVSIPILVARLFAFLAGALFVLAVRFAIVLLRYEAALA